MERLCSPSAASSCLWRPRVSLVGLQVGGQRLHALCGRMHWPLSPRVSDFLTKACTDWTREGDISLGSPPHNFVEVRDCLSFWQTLIYGRHRIWGQSTCLNLCLLLISSETLDIDITSITERWDHRLHKSVVMFPWRHICTVLSTLKFSVKSFSSVLWPL